MYAIRSYYVNIGEKPILSKNGLVTSLAFGINGKVSYCLEGNLNYTGAVITWLKDDVQLIENSLETAELAAKANPADTTYLVPAFSGLGAPYWKSEAKAVLYGMSRTTGKCEIVKAALDCIAYQIADIVFAMQEDAGIAIESLRVDGGPTRNSYLMQFQSDMIKGEVRVSDTEELSRITSYNVCYTKLLRNCINRQKNTKILLESILSFLKNVRSSSLRQRQDRCFCIRMTA